MPTCSAEGCNNHSGFKDGKWVTMHRFPNKQPGLMIQWLQNLGRKDFIITEHSRLCSNHFLEDCFEPHMVSIIMGCPPKRRRLKPDAVPTEFQQRHTAKRKRKSSLLKAEKEKETRLISGTSACNLYSIIKTEPFDELPKEPEPFRVNLTTEKVSASSIEYYGTGNVALLRNFSVSKCQFEDQAVQVSSEEIVTATIKESKTVQTDFDPSTLIVLDPTRVIVLDQSQASEFQGSEIPGFDPTEIPGFDPSRIQGYDPCQDYRAVFVQRDDPVCQEPQEPMDGDIPQSTEIQDMDISSKGTPLQTLIYSPDNVMPKVEEVIKFTENIEIARDKAREVLEELKDSRCSCRPRLYEFILAMQKMVDTASNDVIKMIKQLVDTTKQHQTQFFNLAGLVRKLQMEQSEMERQLLKFKQSSLTVRCASNRKRRLRDEYSKRANLRKNVHISTIVSKIDETKENVEQSQTDTDISLVECDNNQKSEENSTSQEVSKTAEKQEFQTNCTSNNVKVRTKRQVNCDKRTAEFYGEMRRVKRKPVTMSLIQKNPELCEKYTGFKNYARLKDVFNEILKDPNFTESAENGGKSGGRKLSLESEFLMTLVKIKMMVPECYLCSQYKVSRSVVRETVAKWTGVLFRTLNRLTDEAEYSSLKPLLTITKRALNKTQNKSRRSRNSRRTTERRNSSMQTFT